MAIPINSQMKLQIRADLVGAPHAHILFGDDQISNECMTADEVIFRADELIAQLRKVKEDAKRGMRH